MKLHVFCVSAIWVFFSVSCSLQSCAHSFPYILCLFPDRSVRHFLTQGKLLFVLCFADTLSSFASVLIYCLLPKDFHGHVVWALRILECMVLINVYETATRILRRNPCPSFPPFFHRSTCPTRSTSSWSPSKPTIGSSAWRTSWRSWHPPIGPLRSGWHTALKWQPREALTRRHAQ